MPNKKVLSYCEQQEAYLIALKNVVMALPDQGLNFTALTHAIAHFGQTVYAEVLRWIWEMSICCNVDPMTLYEIARCEFCQHALRIRPSAIASHLQNDEDYQRQLSAIKNALTGQLILTEAEEDEAEVAYLKSRLEQVEREQKGELF